MVLLPTFLVEEERSQLEYGRGLNEQKPSLSPDVVHTAIAHVCWLIFVKNYCGILVLEKVSHVDKRWRLRSWWVEDTIQVIEIIISVENIGKQFI